MKGQISAEFIITFSFFVFLVVVLFASITFKLEDYKEMQDRQDTILNCKYISDFIASNLSYKQNEINVSAVKNYLNTHDDFSIIWNDNGYHRIGNVNGNFHADRVYIINGKIENVEVVCR